MAITQDKINTMIYSKEDAWIWKACCILSPNEGYGFHLTTPYRNLQTKGQSNMFFRGLWHNVLENKPRKLQEQEKEN